MIDNTSPSLKSEHSVENHAGVRIVPSYDHAGITIYNGDALEILRQLPDATVNCCITSPPYWGLRDYGTATWDGGDTECDHLQPRRGGDGPASPINGGGSARNTSVGLQQFHGTCRKCGATRIDSQIGIEPTPEAYVARMVEVFREVRRVLRDDGTLWLNLGDSYSDRKIGRADAERNGVDGFTGGQKFKGEKFSQRAVPDGLKPKDLVGIPWRVAFALQADGWYLRSDIIWAKPNPMPESVTDRPTKAHEYLFLLAKSERYWYDAAAIREPFADDRMGNPNGGGQYARELYPVRGQDGLRTGKWTRGEELGGRNKRDVWTVNSDPFPEAHFATFPPALILPCVLAGCPAGGTVLDPFSGAGTTALVAKEQGRRAIGIELNTDYVAMIAKRLSQDVLFPAPPEDERIIYER